MSRKPFHALCNCSADAVTVDFFARNDEDLNDELFISFSTWWAQNRRWRERLRLAWLSMRGKEHYFSEVILDREDSERLLWYLAGELQLNLTQFTYTNTSSNESGKPSFGVKP